ncbi:S1 family peptidase [Thiohalorhabdus sp.]|uniref:S1 family peptidase n=1 Tax=Thiohalorhabdus sp. TaxID=3094134 RepID=UPI002FC3518E
MRKTGKLTLFIAGWLLTLPLTAVAGLPEVIERTERAIVAVGTYNPLGQPAAQFKGTGFAVGDGHRVLTNYHVLPEGLPANEQTYLAVFAGRGDRVRPMRAEKVAVDPKHDLALLRFEGEALPALELGSSGAVRPGHRVAFTGFPIGMVLGMYPVTHEGLISAVTPIATPQGQARSLDSATISRLEEPYEVFQLDATAYPGNSGSPVYREETGKVVGILNMVFVKESKESVLQKPSGIAYAIPVEHARALLGEGK